MGSFYKDYLTFTKKERIGIISLLSLLIMLFFLPGWLAKKSNTIALSASSELSRAIDTLERRKQIEDETAESIQHYQYQPSQNNKFSAGELFAFDPNVLPAEGWKKLGLQDRTVKTIMNYRSKGGKFYRREDVQKIWGLPQGFYETVKEYIVIEETKQTSVAFTATKYERPERRISQVAINEADSSAFIALPGIGSKLASRIINFRNKLGGFYSIEQVGETYGLPDSTFQKIKSYLVADAGAIKKLNINAASKDELKEHPYIKWNLANAIVEYRKQHGNFTSLEELKNIILIDESTFGKIVPYLSL